MKLCDILLCIECMYMSESVCNTLSHMSRLERGNPIDKCHAHYLDQVVGGRDDHPNLVVDCVLSHPHASGFCD